MLYREFGESGGQINLAGDYFNLKIPSNEFQRFIRELFRKRLLVLLDYLPLETSDIIEKDVKYDFSKYLFSRKYRINIETSQSIDDYLLSIGNQGFTTEEKRLIWKYFYEDEIKTYFSYQNYTYLKSSLDPELLDVYLEDLIDNFPLSKATAVIYYTISGCLRYIQAHHPNRKALATRFLNLFKQNIDKNINNPNIKDFNRLDFKKLTMDQYILNEVLNLEDAFFFLPTDKILNTASKAINQ